MRCRHQEINAALAVALAAAFEATETTQQARDNVASFAQHILPDDYARGLQSASWPGRCQVCPLLCSKRLIKCKAWQSLSG